MSKLEANKGTVLDRTELRERREQVERLRSAREAWERESKRAQWWDRLWMRWTSAVGVAIGLAVLAFELCSRPTNGIASPTT